MDPIDILNTSSGRFSVEPVYLSDEEEPSTAAMSTAAAVSEEDDHQAEEEKVTITSRRIRSPSFSLQQYLDEFAKSLLDANSRAPAEPLSVVDYLNNIRNNNPGPWYIANIFGTVYKWSQGRMYRFDTLTASREFRVTDIDRQFELYKSWMSGEEKDGLGQCFPYYQVNVGKDASLVLAYCHRPFHIIRPGHSILVFGQLYLVNGMLNAYFVDDEDEGSKVPTGHLIELKGRSFRMRITSNRVFLFTRKEDAFKDRQSSRMMSTTDSIPTAEQLAAANLVGTPDRTSQRFPFRRAATPMDTDADEDEIDVD